MYENMTIFLGTCSRDKLVPFYPVLGKVEATYLTCFSLRPITPIYNFFPVICIIIGYFEKSYPDVTRTTFAIGNTASYHFQIF